MQDELDSDQGPIAGILMFDVMRPAIDVTIRRLLTEQRMLNRIGIHFIHWNHIVIGVWSVVKLEESSICVQGREYVRSTANLGA